MKRILKKLSLILVFAMIISNIQPNNVLAASKKYVRSLYLSKKTMTISVGKRKSLSYKVKVKGKASKKISVKISNSNVKAKIKKGKIHILAKKAGTSKITISTKAKNRKGKKIKKTIKIKIIKGSVVTTTPIPMPARTPVPTKTPTPSTSPNATVSPSGTGIEVTKSEWLSTVMNTTGFRTQKELFDYDGNGNVSYSFTDIIDDVNADMIETAVKYGIIPNTSNEFKPNDAADREFLAITSVRAIGFATDELESNYYDKADLKYEKEDAIAIQLELLKLSDNRFLPTKAITKAEKQNAERILSDIVKSRNIDEKHTDIVEYSEDVVDEKNVTDYIISEENGIYTVMTLIGTSLDNVNEGDKIILPATDSYPEGIALIVSSSVISSDGKTRILTGTMPDDIAEFVDAIDIEGVADADENNATAVDGVATVEVTKENKENNPRKSINNNELKRASIDGEIDLKDKTKFCFTIKEIETTVSFYLSELKYRVDFNKKGVNDLYIGLPSVLSMDTDYKASKNFSKKIGDIPIKLAAGFSANIEVYLDASINGEISMNLKLSNNVGMHYYNGQFYVIKSCEPSFDAIVDADVDAGARLQLGLYWMKGIKEVFGKNDPRPVYNVNTKWGMHGDATLHIRNDQYTAYENLSCVDLAYYLYGNVSVGNGSFLGDKFNLKKTWIIFNDENSPLKGAWHIENGKLVNLCTYKFSTYTLLETYAKQFLYLCNDVNMYDIYACLEEDTGFVIQYDNIPDNPFAYDIDDFDNDGNEELLIAKFDWYTSDPLDYGDYGDVTYSYKAVYLEMYEVENGNVVKQATSDYKFEDNNWFYYISPVDDEGSGNTVLYKYLDKTPIIALEQHSSRPDAYGITFRAFKYNGKDFVNIGNSGLLGSDFDDMLPDIEKTYENIGINLDAEQLVYGGKSVYNYVDTPTILGKSISNMIVDYWSIVETVRDNPSLQYKVSDVKFSIN